jgi:serine/threonine protein kinase
MILKSKGTNGDYIEMDEEMIYVEMRNGKKGKLEIQQTLYEAPTTIVYKGIMNNEIDVVVKIMKMWGTKLDSSQSREMELMRKLQSDYIVEYYGTSVIEGRLGIVMEFMPLGSLEGLMSKKVLSSELKIRYVREICYGMKYLHSMNIIHRDLKLTNVLVVSDDSNSTQAICKISDFGTSREVDMKSTLSMSQSMTMTSNIGTPLYMAPEILSGVGHYSMKADVYSYGILMVSLWNQKPPYYEIHNREAGDLLSDITTRGLRPRIQSECPQSYFNLLSACLVEDPHSRPSFDEICKNVFDS